MADLDKIVDSLSDLSVIEAADLVKKLEEKWDVSAPAPLLEGVSKDEAEAAKKALEEAGAKVELK